MYGKILYGWANSEVYLEPGEISEMELFMKITNGYKSLIISIETFHHVVITYITGERFYLNIFFGTFFRRLKIIHLAIKI